MLRVVPTEGLPLTENTCFYDNVNNMLFTIVKGELVNKSLSSMEINKIEVACNTGITRQPSSQSLLPIEGNPLISLCGGKLRSLDACAARGSSVFDLPTASTYSWEIEVVPWLSAVKLGVCSLGEPRVEIAFEFTSRLPRTVTFTLTGCELTATASQALPRCKPLPPGKWSPFVSVLQSKVTILYTPLAEFSLPPSPPAHHSDTSSSKHTPHVQFPLPPSTPAQHSDTSQGKHTPHVQFPLPSTQHKKTPEDKLDTKIHGVRQLSNKRMLLEWVTCDNAKGQKPKYFVKVLHRHPYSNTFVFPKISCTEHQVQGLLSEQQHGLIEGYCKRNSLVFLPYEKKYDILEITTKLRNILYVLKQKGDNEVRGLICKKIRFLIPYLCEPLTSPVANENTIIRELLFNQTSCTPIFGQILSVTSNFMLTLENHTLKVYSLKKTVKQIFKCTPQQLSAFKSKPKSLLTFNQPSIYKVFDSALKDQQNQQHIKYQVSQNNVEQLMKDFDVSEEKAKEALSQTGDIEKALIWLCSDKKKDEPAVQKPSKGDLIELNIPFCRLALLYAGKVYLLGINDKCFNKSNDSWIDLLDLTQCKSIDEFQERRWYDYASLTLLDSLAVNHDSFALSDYRCSPKSGDNREIHSFIVHGPQMIRVSINPLLLFESECCLSKIEKEESAVASLFTVNKESLLVSSVRALINDPSHEMMRRKNTNVFLDSILVSNRSERVDSLVQLEYLSEVRGPAVGGLSAEETLQLAVESGPRGCSNHYSLAHVLHKDKEFLTTTTSPLLLRHIHAKLISLSSITFTRTSKLYSNKILKGVLTFFKDDQISPETTFAFAEAQTQVTVNIPFFNFWQCLRIQFKFQQKRRLPFEIGYISAKGYSVERAIAEKQLKPLLNLQFRKRSIHIKGFKSIKWTQRGYRVIGVLNKRIEEKYHHPQIRLKRIFKTEESEYTSVYETWEDLQSKFDKNQQEAILEVFMNSYGEFIRPNCKEFVRRALYSRPEMPLLIAKMLENNQCLNQTLTLFKSNILIPPTVPYNHLKLVIPYLSKQDSTSFLESILIKNEEIKNPLYKRLSTKDLFLEKQFYLNPQYKSDINCVKVYKDESMHIQAVSQKSSFGQKTQIRLLKRSNVSYILLKGDAKISQIQYEVLIFDAIVSSSESHAYSHLTHKTKGKILNQTLGEQFYGLYMSNVPCTEIKIELRYAGCESEVFFEVFGEALVEKANFIKDSHDVLFQINKEDLLFLTEIQMHRMKYEKFVFTNNPQKSYLASISNEEESLREKLFQKVSAISSKLMKSAEPSIEERQIKCILNLQQKYVSRLKTYSKQVCLDYLHTSMVLVLQEFERKSIVVSESMGQKLVKMAMEERGKVQAAAIKALTHDSAKLLKVLPNVEQQIKFTPQELDSMLKMARQNTLTPQVAAFFIANVPYSNHWAQVLAQYSSNLIKEQNPTLNPPKSKPTDKQMQISQIKIQDNQLFNRTQKQLQNNTKFKDIHVAIIDYIICHSQFLKSQNLIKYFVHLTDLYFFNNFLPMISQKLLSLCIPLFQTNPIKQNKMLGKLLSFENPPLTPEIVDVMLHQEKVPWDSFSSLNQKIVTAFLTRADLQTVGLYPKLLKESAKVAYRSSYAPFLAKIFHENMNVFKRIISQNHLLDGCEEEEILPLAIFVEYLARECNMKGLLGTKLSTEKEVLGLRVGVSLGKMVGKGSTASLIEWYLNNSPYEFGEINPANRPPAFHLMRELIAIVLGKIKPVNPFLLLETYEKLLAAYLDQSSAKTLAQKHLAVLVLNDGMLTLLNTLKESVPAFITTAVAKLKKYSQLQFEEWSPKEIEVLKNATIVGREVKNIEANRGGSLDSLCTVDTNELTITLQVPVPLTKIIIGFNSPSSTNKQNVILPTSVFVESNNKQIAELQMISDLHYAGYGVVVFAFNFLRSAEASFIVKSLTFRFAEPHLPSISDCLETPQKHKKSSFYSVSFIHLTGFATLPKHGPSVIDIYLKILLSGKLTQLTESLEKEIITVLNKLLPNKDAEQFLLSMQQRGINVIMHLLKTKNPNPQTLRKLYDESSANIYENIHSLVDCSLKQKQLNSILINVLRMASYKLKQPSIFNIPLEQVLWNYSHERLDVIAALLTVPSLYPYDINALIDSVWPKKQTYYPLLLKVLPYHHQSIQYFAQKHLSEVIDSLLPKMAANQLSASDLKTSSQAPQLECIAQEMELLTILSTEEAVRLRMITEESPIRIARSLANPQRLLVLYPLPTLRTVIKYLANTCVNSECSDALSEFVIVMMEKLVTLKNEISLSEQNYFIHQFFFPLMNSFRSIAVVFRWKHSKGYLFQPTDVLQRTPIRLLKRKAKADCGSSETEAVVASSQIAIEEPPQTDTQTEATHFLTNSVFLSLKNPLVLPSKYKSISSYPTFEHIYNIPYSITVEQLLREMSICGFRFPTLDMWADNRLLPFTSAIPNSPLLSLEIDAQSIFKATSIQEIAEQKPLETEIRLEETIFTTFEKQKGMFKLIDTIMVCISSWKNEGWNSYLTELKNFSALPSFGTLYMKEKANLQLLFDLLAGSPLKDPARWQLKEETAVKDMYRILANVFELEGETGAIARDYALKNGFYALMLERLHLLTKEPKRTFALELEEEVVTTLEKKLSEEESNTLAKKKGIGYGTHSSKNEQWDPAELEAQQREKDQKLLNLLIIINKLLAHKSLPDSIVHDSFASALLPILESSFRSGSLLEVSKRAELLKGELELVRTMAGSKLLVKILLEVPATYQPKQAESVYSLLATMANTAKVFLGCLTGATSEKVSEEVAKSIVETEQQVSGAVAEYQGVKGEEKLDELPLAKKYVLLLKDRRFDYCDMKPGGKNKHHYFGNYQAGHKAPAAKTLRLAQELADLSQALPTEHTNAIFVRCDTQRVDFMQALIMGSNGTPYAHGAYLFDIYFEDTYPLTPPKVNLATTGSAQIRFNPNLYSCGKVCLSLLGTWRGNAMENWVPAVSTLLQVLLSIQSIIMSEDVYFNEPGFEHEQGTPAGESKNEAYANIVRHGNVKFAMLQNIRNPPVGFESVIRTHFYLKKEEILHECRKWLLRADKRDASYTGLVGDHNANWASLFKNKDEYRNSLEKAINELEKELNKLPKPSLHNREAEEKPLGLVPRSMVAKAASQEKYESLEEVDVGYETDVGYGTETGWHAEMDVNDEKVKDRWSRYIGAMGVEAVSKQSRTSVLLFGLGPLAVEIAKNIILSGCKRLTICDSALVTPNDLAGQFFVQEQDLGQDRLTASLHKLQQLNHYVRVDALRHYSLPLLTDYGVVISTQHKRHHQIQIDSFCRQNGIKFIATDCFGPYGYLFNDFGDEFEVLDKNGEEAVEVMIENITREEAGVVTLLKGLKHPFQDGEVVKITGVKGMLDANSTDPTPPSINNTLHKIKGINQNSFSIGDTTAYTPYESNGFAKNIKMPTTIKYLPLAQDCPIDPNLFYSDFEKAGDTILLQHCISIVCSHDAPELQPAVLLKAVEQASKKELSPKEREYVNTFASTYTGVFAPLCAFFGGLVSQEVFKAITNKHTPINQYFYLGFPQIIGSTSETEDSLHCAEKVLHGGGEESHGAEEELQSLKSKALVRLEPLRKIVGGALLRKIRDCRVFVVGSGAIGCELLKNYAMLSVGSGEGWIVVTDPDHIETSNLNRQFLFREKHLQKAKSVTACAAVAQMNPLLKGKLKAKLDRVCHDTRDIFSNAFFESMTVVTNALDSVQARQYVDQRCVESKLPLLESGTLGPKGHVQVIVPYATETYGSKADPADEGDIPHCTLKMFPQETLHCIEWARDLFGKFFALGPKAHNRLLAKEGAEDVALLKDSLAMVRNRPRSFDDALYQAALLFFKLYRNDILQLLYTYPLDAKTKDNKPFWKLPKRPPAPILAIDPEDPLHHTFIATFAALLCKIHRLDYPKDFRSTPVRRMLAIKVLKYEIPPFVPSDKAAQQLSSEVDSASKAQEPASTSSQSTSSQSASSQSTELHSHRSAEELYAEFMSLNPFQLQTEEFEKDQDSNGHIDLIFAMSNLRARNYSLSELDWITTKLKAGKITPALSTTTSCIAALQTIELVKLLKGCKLPQLRNTFLNLAVPVFQFGEPGEVEKIKIHEGLITNVWERWEIGPLPLQHTLGLLIEEIQAKFLIRVKQLDLYEGGQIYSDLVLGLESKKNEKETALKKTIKQIVEELGGDCSAKYVDTILVLGVGDTLAKHVPTLRVHLA